MISIVVPVYRNAANIPSLLDAIANLKDQLTGDMEAVFVVDGSPDNSYQLLRDGLPECSFPSQLLHLSRNYGAQSAVRAGFAAARGDIIAVMAADLQEPPELVVEFQRKLTLERYDVAVGVREARHDPFLTRLFSECFWRLYRALVLPDIPAGGIDIFGCTEQVKNELLNLSESRSSLIGLLFWTGFRRAEVSYIRRPRKIGVSAWTLRKKVKYLLDSVFCFSELPIRLLTNTGLFGLAISALWALIVVIAKLTGSIQVPGYSATIVAVTFFGGLNCFGLGIVGEYVWRAFENTKQRPNYIVSSQKRFDGNV
jgi:glycosyltransferase involved in cell wall biosynthesis